MKRYLLFAVAFVVGTQFGCAKDQRGAEDDSYSKIVTKVIEHVKEDDSLEKNVIVIVHAKAAKAIEDKIPASHQSAYLAHLSAEANEPFRRALEATGYLVTTGDSLRVLIERGEAKSESVIFLSQIGFDTERRTAVVRGAWGCGDMCFYEGLFLFTRGEDGWDLTDVIGIAVS